MKYSWLNKMYKSISFIICTAGMFSPHVHAATEFLRFEGTVSPFYGGDDPRYPAPLGLVPNQSIYFDFQIDTNQDVLGFLDVEFLIDYFAVTYLAGSIAGPNVTHGVTVNFPEGITTQIFIIEHLRVGASWDSLNDQQPLIDDRSISTWNVGANIPLLYTYNPDFIEEITIANLEMTYRNTIAPQAIVPIPAAVWLFGSGLIVLVGLTRPKNA